MSYSLPLIPADTQEAEVMCLMHCGQVPKDASFVKSLLPSIDRKQLQGRTRRPKSNSNSIIHREGKVRISPSFLPVSSFLSIIDEFEYYS